MDKAVGFYRGEVIDISGDYGKCKIFVPFIYPDEFKNNPNAIPWAEPAMPLFGGNYKGNGANSETGFSGWPKVGAIVWVFFEHGNINYPIYAMACQGQDGWLAEHNKQWVMKSDNVSIIIDEKEPTKILIKSNGNIKIEIVGNTDIITSGTTNIKAALVNITAPTTMIGNTSITGNLTVSGNVQVAANLNTGGTSTATARLGGRVPGDVF